MIGDLPRSITKSDRGFTYARGGTGINAPNGCGEQIAAELSDLTGLPLSTAPNKRMNQAPRSCPAR
jgi:fumarate hydratase class II